MYICELFKFSELRLMYVRLLIYIIYFDKAFLTHIFLMFVTRLCHQSFLKKNQVLL